MRAAQTILATLLVAALVGVGTGCDTGGTNGDGDGPDITAPAAPSDLTGESRDAAVDLSWSGVDAEDLAGYNVYRDTASIGDNVEELDPENGSLLSETSYPDEEVENGTTYYYRVTAVAREGEETAESDGSGEVSGTPFAPPTALEGTSKDSQVALAWTAAAGAETYDLYRDTSSMGGADGDPLTTGVSEATYTDSTAENGTKYYYRVTSVNPEGEESTASNEVETTPFSDPPDRP